MKQGLEVEPTPVEGVVGDGVEIDVKNHILRIKHTDYTTLLWLVAKGLKNLTVYNRGNTTYLKATKILRASFFDEYGLLKVHALPITLSQVSYILHKLRDVGLIDRVDGIYVLSRTSQLWDLAKNSSPNELAEFLLETIMTMEG
jgi:hypothetical protein